MIALSEEAEKAVRRFKRGILTFNEADTILSRLGFTEKEIEEVLTK